MKVRIKYRVHGAAEAVLQPGQVVELDEGQALDLIRLGAAEDMEGTAEDALPLAPKKAKDRGKSSLGPAGGAAAPDSPQAGRQDRAPADMHTPEGG